jgi:hypothetical protein
VANINIYAKEFRDNRIKKIRESALKHYGGKVAPEVIEEIVKDWIEFYDKKKRGKSSL